MPPEIIVFFQPMYCQGPYRAAIQKACVEVLITLRTATFICVRSAPLFEKWNVARDLKKLHMPALNR